MQRPLVALVVLAGMADSLWAGDDAPALGIFQQHGEIGTLAHPGSVRFDDQAGTYTVAGSGENMWFARDAFHFVRKKATGDLSLAADISFVGPGKAPHRKACLLI